MRERINDFLVRLAGPVMLGMVLGLAGPFGTYDLLPTPQRTAYWLSVVSLNWLLCDIGIRRTDAMIPVTVPGRRLVVPLAGSLIVSVPATGLVFMAGDLSGLGRPDGILALYWKVLLLLAAISIPVYTWADRRESAMAETEDPPPYTPEPDYERSATEIPKRSLFFDRLRKPLPGNLLCLETQDHYLAIHTTEGTELLLCRMEDATRELDGLGRRVHRSWWVADGAVDHVVREGQRHLLHLRDGRRVPVGRSYKPRLRKAGWLE